MNLLVYFSAWAELVWQYLLEVTNTVNPSLIPGSTLKNRSNPNPNPDLDPNPKSPDCSATNHYWKKLAWKSRQLEHCRHPRQLQADERARALCWKMQWMWHLQYACVRAASGAAGRGLFVSDRRALKAPAARTAVVVHGLSARANPAPSMLEALRNYQGAAIEHRRVLAGNSGAGGYSRLQWVYGIHLPVIVHRALSRWSSQQRMGRNQQPKGGGYAGNKGVGAATAQGVGAPQQNTMLSGVAGLGMVQQNPLDSLFGSTGTNTMTELGGFGADLPSANSGNDLLQLAALLGGSQQQNVTFQPAQLLQVRQALVQQQATQLAAQQTEIQKRFEAEAATRV